MPSILFVLSSAAKNLVGGDAGWYLPEAAHPYYILAPHVSIDIVTPEGPNPPVNPYSVESFRDDESVKFLQDPEVKKKLENAKRLVDVKADDYDAIFYVGGQGPVLDLAHMPENAKLASEFYRTGKIVSAVCHGTAALVGVTDANGVSIFKGKPFTGFSNAEEAAVGPLEAVPFLLEDKLQSLGGKYEKADEIFQPKVVVFGKFITGQNPASAKLVGEALLKALTE